MKASGMEEQLQCGQENEGGHPSDRVYQLAAGGADPDSGAPGEDTRRRAERLEREAREIPAEEAERSAELFGLAAAAWRELYERQEQRDSFLASRMMYCLRRSGREAAELLPEARQLVGRHPDSHFVRAHLAWLCHRAMKDAVALGDVDWSLEIAAEAVAQVAYLPQPQRLCSAVVHALRALYRQAEQLPRERSERASAIAAFLRELGEPLSVHLEGKAAGTRKCSPLELFYYLARQVGREAGDWELLEEYIGKAVERFPGNEWFAQLHVECALRAGQPESALERARQHRQRLPQSVAVAEAYADACCALERSDEARRILADACRSRGAFWNWHKLARLYEQAGELQAAEQACACGLAGHRPEDAGKVWKLHLLRSRLCLLLGRLEEAAREAWLSREARTLSGWAMNAEQVVYLEENADTFGEFFSRLDAEPAGRVRKQALAGYRKTLEHARQADLQEGSVEWYDEAKGFGFVKLRDGRKAFLHRSVLRGYRPEAGERVRVTVADSFDRKKQRPSLKVSSIERAGDD